MLNVAPARPVAPYRGGKRNLAGRLVEMIDAIPHRTYAEPFVGMGGVFLRRHSKPQAEVINDLGRDVATFYRVMQRHYAAFVDLLRYQLTCRAEFDRLNALDPNSLTDLERAARFLYLQTTAYGGKTVGRTFGTGLHRPARFNLLRLSGLLQDFHDRLTGVVIECLPFERFVAIYDSSDTLMYVDPPYWGCEDDYGAELFSRSDFARLRAVLDSLKGRFILSINDLPETRDLFKGFEQRSVTTTYGLQGGAKPARELIVTNLPVVPSLRQ